jgi:hypothetical protein
MDAAAANPDDLAAACLGPPSDNPCYDCRVIAGVEIRGAWHCERCDYAPNPDGKTCLVCFTEKFNVSDRCNTCTGSFVCMPCDRDELGGMCVICDRGQLNEQRNG